MAEPEGNRWDEVFSRREVAFSTEPNPFLMEVAAGRTPGRALEIGMGQGRNSIWLARQGWDVTGLDGSSEALRQAEEQVRGKDLRLRMVHTALEAFDLGVAEWDMIVGMYVHGLLIRDADRITAALKPGGVLVVEGFHRDVMKLGVEALGGGVCGYTTNSLLRHFPRLRVERYEDRMGLGEWRMIEAPIVRMVARKE
jgi:2-polyprenyl-3-methyl-5-hydroxy-6-metoxy-1,4-benzoquinol methylase